VRTLASACTHCAILADFEGSDHAPVEADFALPPLALPDKPAAALPLSSRVRWRLSGGAPAPAASITVCQRCCVDAVCLQPSSAAAS
jgi:hypothetical protein